MKAQNAAKDMKMMNATVTENVMNVNAKKGSVKNAMKGSVKNAMKESVVNGNAKNAMNVNANNRNVGNVNIIADNFFVNRNKFMLDEKYFSRAYFLF